MWVIRSVSTRRTSCDGSASRRITDFPPRDMAHSAQPDASDVEQRHCHQADDVVVDVERQVRSADGGGQVGVAEHDPLGSPVVPEV